MDERSAARPNAQIDDRADHAPRVVDVLPPGRRDSGSDFRAEATNMGPKTHGVE